MIRVDRFQYWHLHAIDSALPLPSREELHAVMTGREDEWGVTGICVHTERVLWCVGAQEAWPGRAVAWGRVSRRMNSAQVLRTVKAVRQLLDGLPYERVDCVADTRFPQAGRLLQLWGFVFEGRMRKFRDGLDFDLYALVK